MQIDICIPTFKSKSCIEETLYCLKTSVENTDLASINRILVVNKGDREGIKKILKSKCEEYGWKLIFKSGNYPLQEARKICINMVETEWFIFLDDDVRVGKDYIEKHIKCISNLVGAVQGRKESSHSDPSRWLPKRSYRGGTHVTLIRTSLVKNVKFPKYLEVLEGQYLRLHICETGHIWFFNRISVFRHDSQMRHSIDYKQGYLAAKYSLLPFHYLILLFLNSKSTKHIFLRIGALIGWILGSFMRQK